MLERRHDDFAERERAVRSARVPRMPADSPEVGARWRYDYFPFGLPYDGGSSVVVSQRYTYTGREQNPNRRLMCFRTRTHDPEIALMLSRNPWGYVQGRMRLYDAMRNRPANTTEPFSFTLSSEQETDWSWFTYNDAFGLVNPDDFFTGRFRFKHAVDVEYYRYWVAWTASAYTDRARGTRADQIRVDFGIEMPYCQDEGRVAIGLGYQGLGPFGFQGVQNWLHDEYDLGDPVNMQYPATENWGMVFDIRFNRQFLYLPEPKMSGFYVFEGTLATGGAGASEASLGLGLQWNKGAQKAEWNMRAEMLLTRYFGIPSVLSSGYGEAPINVRLGASRSWSFDWGSINFGFAYETNPTGLGPCAQHEGGLNTPSLGGGYIIPFSVYYSF